MSDAFHRLKAQKRLQQDVHNVRAKLIEAGILPPDPPEDLRKYIPQIKVVPRRVPDFITWSAPKRRTPQSFKYSELKELYEYAEPFCKTGYLPRCVLLLLQQRMAAVAIEG